MSKKKQESGAGDLETFEHYVDFRRHSPELLIALPKPYEDELVHETSFREDAEAHGFDRDLALRATTEFEKTDVEQFSLALLEKLLQRKEAYTKDTAAVRTKKAIPLSFIDYAISALLRLCNDAGVAPPVDLYALVIARLYINGAPRKAQHLMMYNREWAEIEIWRLLSAGQEPGPLRAFAKRINVSASTITRWFGPGGFEQAMVEMRTKLKSVDE